MEILNIKISELDTTKKIRRINKAGLDELMASIKKGYADDYPVLIDMSNVVIAGHHRIEACKQLGIETIIAIRKDIPETDRIKTAILSNEATESGIRMTFIDYAELIWSMSGTQDEISKVTGISLDRVKKLSNLRRVPESVWSVISKIESGGSEKVPCGTFSEGLLRPILKLTDEQQTELVEGLIAGDINKNKFKTLAERYAKQNTDEDALIEALAGVSDELIQEGIDEIRTGNYDLDKLIAVIQAKHKKATNYTLIHGSFYDEDVSGIDLIVTDPPYNISHENERVYEGRGNISMDFGEWDKVGHDEFKGMLNLWADRFAKMLTEKGSGYVFTSDAYIGHLRESLEAAGLHYRATIIWHKNNPGTSPTKKNYISAVEYIAYFTKSEDRTFNWMGDAEMHNFIELPVCAGNERMKDGRNNTLHPTQKPESLLRHLIEISSNKGDVVFDGFMGVGSTGAVCKKMDRKFIGIELDDKYYNAAVKRIGRE